MSTRFPTADYWKTPEDGLWRFALVGANSEPMNASQGYKTKQGVLRGIEAARKAWARAVPRLVDCAPSRR